MTIGSPLNKHIVCWPELSGEVPAWPGRRQTHRRRTVQGHHTPADRLAQLLRPSRPDRLQARDHPEVAGGSRMAPRLRLSGGERPPVRSLPPPRQSPQRLLAGRPGLRPLHPDGRQARLRGAVLNLTASGDRFWPGILSVASYLVPFGLLFTGVYFFYKGVHSAVGRSDPLTGGEITKDVFLITCLLGSITVLARIPRLCRKPILQAGALAYSSGRWSSTARS